MCRFSDVLKSMLSFICSLYCRDKLEYKKCKLTRLVLISTSSIMEYIKLKSLDVLHQ